MAAERSKSKNGKTLIKPAKFPINRPTMAKQITIKKEKKGLRSLVGGKWVFSIFGINLRQNLRLQIGKNS